MATLYIVPTPIGNLQDITRRALEVLQEVDEILAEDTRVTRKLLKHYNISKPLSSFHAFNEHGTTSGVIEKLQAGTSLALVSDAGTPGISDPGFLLVRVCDYLRRPRRCLPAAIRMRSALSLMKPSASRWS